MADADPSLKWRILSAIVLAPAVLALVVWGVWPFALLAAVAVVLLAIEWRHLMAAQFDQRTGDLAGLATGLCALLIVAMAAVGWYRPAISTIAICLGIAGIAAPMLRISPAWPFGGIAYLSLPMLAMIWLRGLPEIGLTVLLWLLFVVWATDIMAYAVGRWLGGPRLAPSISPGKTWAGLCGGMAGAAIVGAVAALIIGPFRMLPSILLAAGLAGVAQIGDLTESALKRKAGVKDSGGLIPGHGGLFDRIDGLLFAAPVLAAFLLLSGRQELP